MDNKSLCSNCGSVLEKGDGFCSDCGAKVEKNDANKLDFQPMKANDNQAVMQPVKEKISKKILFYSTIAIVVLCVISWLFLSQKWKKPYNNVLDSSINNQTETAAVNTLNNKEKQGNSTENVAKDTSKVEESKDDTSNGSQSKDINMVNLEAYLPIVDNKYTYSIVYPDGEKSKRDIVVGRLNNSILLSTALVEADTPVEVVHYVKRTDGIYFVWDRDPEKYYLWLPNQPKVGSEWNDSGIKYIIVKVDEKCDLDFLAFNSCIVVDVYFTETGFSERRWYAPGSGNVLTTSLNGKNEFLKLTDISTRPEAEVRNILVKNSKNIW